MSYVSLLKNIPEILSQPTGIAAIASVGIHGAIALIVPLMPVDSNKPKETDSSKSVGILELSQADQNRLPQTPGTPQNAVAQQLPQFPQQQQQLALQPPTIPSNLNGQTTVFPPSPSSNLTQPPLSSVPIAPNKYSVSSFPQRNSIRIPNTGLKFDDSGFKASNPTISPPVPNFNDKSVVPQGLPAPQVTEPPQLQPGNIPPEITNSQNQEPVPTPNIASGDSGITPQPGSNPTDTQTQTSETIITQNPKNGELINQAEDYKELRNLLKRQYPDSEEKPVIRDKIAVSKPGVEGKVLGFVVVDPDSKKLEIKYQGKLPSPILDVRTRQYFKTKSLKGDQKISLYPFELRFEDSNKTAGTTPRLEPTPSVTTQPSSKPTTDNPIIIRPGNSTQLTPIPSATAEPSFTPTPLNTTKPSTSTPSTTLKPSLVPTPSETNKPSTTTEPSLTPTPSETTEVSPTTTTNSNQPSSSQEPDRQLLQKLREVQEQRENSQPKK